MWISGTEFMSFGLRLAPFYPLNHLASPSCFSRQDLLVSWACLYTKAGWYQVWGIHLSPPPQYLYGFACPCLLCSRITSMCHLSPSLAFPQESWGSNAGPHACKPCPLLTKPHPQACTFCAYLINSAVWSVCMQPPCQQPPPLPRG